MYWHGDARQASKSFRNDGQNTRLTSRVFHAGIEHAIYDPAGLQPTGGAP